MGRPKGTIVYPRPSEKWLKKAYWEDLLSSLEVFEKWLKDFKPKTFIKTKNGIAKAKWIQDVMKDYKIPQRTSSERTSLWQLKKKGINNLETYFFKKGKRISRVVFEDFYGLKPKPNEIIHHKDFVPQNDHPLNLEPSKAK